MSTERLAINSITADQELQVREQLNAQALEDYATAYINGDELPPIHVFEEGETYWLADGFHRVRAASSIELDELDAVIHQGDRAAAIWYAAGCNKTNGVYPTQADKARAVRKALVAKPGESNASIARHVGVSGMTVEKYRQELEAASQIGNLPDRTGADGKQYPAKRPAQTHDESETTREIVNRETGEVIDQADVIETKTTSHGNGEAEPETDEYADLPDLPFNPYERAKNAPETRWAKAIKRLQSELSVLPERETLDQLDSKDRQYIVSRVRDIANQIKERIK